MAWPLRREGDLRGPLVTDPPRVARWPVLAAVLVAVVWGLCFVLIRSSMEDTTALFSAGLRGLLGGLVLGAWVMVHDRSGTHWRLPRLSDLVFLALANAGVAFGAMYLAAERAAAMTASVLAGVQPILLAVAGRALFGDRLGKAAAWGLSLGLAGVTLVAASASGSTSGVGVALALVAAAAPAAGTIRMRRLADRVDIAATTAAQFLLGRTILVVAAVGLEDVSATRWSVGLIVWLVILGVVGTGIAYAIWFTLLRSLSLVALGGSLFLVSAGRGRRWGNSRRASTPVRVGGSPCDPVRYRVGLMGRTPPGRPTGGCLASGRPRASWESRHDGL